MPNELDKIYNPQAHEDAVYKQWEESGFFNPDICVAKGVCKKNAPAFSVMLPPPNVTGHLHIGHSVMLALQDIMARYHRMKGDKTLWLPGTDHAAIATQSKVEKLLWEEEKKTRHDLGREMFLQRVEKFAQDSHDVIINQSKKMGSSLDWSREVYTLDDERSLAVRTAFKKMYDEGLIYRGMRIVNWDPKLQTTVSDDEVEWAEERVPFYYLQYGPFVIGTARPETKFGDKYVVMHPDDDRYKEYKHGQTFACEWINGQITATVIKDETVDPSFGSGVMTITPWHDGADFEIAERHNLDKEQIIDYDGQLMDIAGEFKGLHIAEGRKAIVKKLQNKGLLVKIEENYVHNIATNSRGGGTIEPQIKLQWFIAVNKEFKRGNEKVTLKKLMQAAVRSKKIEILPERFEKTYFRWIDNLRDWCISRQIWYGHRVPVWYCGEQSKDMKRMGFAGDIVAQVFDTKTRTYRLRDHGLKVGDRVAFEDSTKKNIFGYGTITEVQVTTVGAIDLQDAKHWKTYNTLTELIAAFKRHHPEKEVTNDTPAWVYTYTFDATLQRGKCGTVMVAASQPEQCISCGSTNLVQDSDTLDTWFSSGLWTFSSLGWPEQTKDLQTYHPTSVLETGYDILFFWVARMILMTTYLLDDIPFEKVYLHGLVRDEQGRKMSKSLGNVIDPLDVIKKYGTDAVRLSLVIGSTPGNDVKLSEQKIASYRNFTNKLWNIARYVLASVPAGTAAPRIEPLQVLGIKTPLSVMRTAKGAITLADQWIMEHMVGLITNVTKDIEEFRFSQAGERLREFTWNTFADWYIEIAKFEKSERKDQMLVWLLETMLKLWHPFMPFVTEHIWREMGHDGLLMTEPWPDADYFRGYSDGSGYGGERMFFDTVKDIITAIRAIRSEYKIEPKKKISAVIYAGDLVELIKDQKTLIERLRTGAEVEIKAKGDVMKEAAYAVVDTIEIYIPLKGLVDITKEKTRLEKRSQELKQVIANSDKKLDNQEFVHNAPKEVVQTEIDKAENYKQELKQIKEQIKHLV